VYLVLVLFLKPVLHPSSPTNGSGRKPNLKSLPKQRETKNPSLRPRPPSLPHCCHAPPAPHFTSPRPFPSPYPLDPFICRPGFSAAVKLEMGAAASSARSSLLTHACSLHGLLSSFLLCKIISVSGVDLGGLICPHCLLV